MQPLGCERDVCTYELDKVTDETHDDEAHADRAADLDVLYVRAKPRHERREAAVS